MSSAAPVGTDPSVLQANAAPATAALRLFGPPHMVNGASRLDLPASAPAWLLACLAVAGDWMPREQLALLFWPDDGTADAQRHLRVTLHRSRQMLHKLGLGAALQAQNARLRLCLPCDVGQFRAACVAGDWTAALALHQAPLLGQQPVRSYAALDDWLARRRDQLLADWRSAALHEAQRLADQGQARRAVDLLQAQLQHDLLAEDAVQALLRNAAAADERVAALLTYERFCALAQAELGLDPLPATVALAQALKAPAAGPRQPVPIRPSADRGRPPVPMVGRGADLAVLTAACAAGAGLRLITGEPGLGKTRLVQSLVANTAPNALWLQAREDWQRSPLEAVSQALTQALGARADAVRRLQLPASALRALDRLQLPSAAPHAPSRSEGVSPTPENALVAAVADLLRAWPEPIIVDDLQWLDAVSLQALEQSLIPTPEAARAAPVAASSAASASAPPCVIATLRSAEASPALQQWLDRQEAGGRLRQQALPPLSATAMAELVALATGGAAPRFARWLAERTGGNPLFALECLAGLDGAHPDAWPDSAWAQAVPVRVAAMLQRRLARLDEATQRVLSIAAIAGDAQQLELLAGLAGLSAWATAQALAEAQAAGLLSGRQFAHGLVRELVAQRTPEPLRAVVHAGLARRLADRLPPHRVADHWWAAGEPSAAVAATLAAADLDATRGLYIAAQALLAEALARLPDERPTHSDDAAQLAVKQAFIVRQTGDLDRAEHHLSQALERLPLPATQQLAWGERFELAMVRGQLEAAEACLARARELNPELPTLWLDGAKLAHAQGEAARCAELMGHYVGWLRRRPPGAELAGALTAQGVGRDMQGHHDRALPLHQEALAIARRIGARHTEVEVINNLVVCLGELGRDRDAVRQGLPVLKAWQADGHPLQPTLAVNLAYSLLALGRLDPAEALYRQLAASEHTSVACAACGKLLEIQSRRGQTGAALDAAVDAVFEALAATEMYTVQVSAMLAVLNHGRQGDAPRVLAWVRDEALPAGLQERLDVALAARGLQLPVAT